MNNDLLHLNKLLIFTLQIPTGKLARAKIPIIYILLLNLTLFPKKNICYFLISPTWILHFTGLTVYGNLNSIKCLFHIYVRWTRLIFRMQLSKILPKDLQWFGFNFMPHNNMILEMQQGLWLAGKPGILETTLMEFCILRENNAS